MEFCVLFFFVFCCLNDFLCFYELDVWKLFLCQLQVYLVWCQVYVVVCIVQCYVVVGFVDQFVDIFLFVVQLVGCGIFMWFEDGIDVVFVFQVVCNYIELQDIDGV